MNGVLWEIYTSKQSAQTLTYQFLSLPCPEVKTNSSRAMAEHVTV